MKRLASLFLALMLVLSLQFTAFADMGMPEEPLFESFVVTKQFIVEDYNYGSERTLPIGQKLSFYNKYEDSERNTTVWSATASVGDNEIWFEITDEQMRLTMPSNEVFETSNAPEPEYEVTARVTAEPCLNLRNGPATGFDILTVIPLDAVINYKYVYKNYGESWAYTSYEGKSGWICLDYVETQKEVSLNTALNTDNETTDSGTNAWDFVPKDEESFLDTLSKMFGNNSGKMIIFCIIGAVVLAAFVFAVILLVIRYDNKRGGDTQNTIDINDIK